MLQFPGGNGKGESWVKTKAVWSCKWKERVFSPHFLKSPGLMMASSSLSSALFLTPDSHHFLLPSSCAHSVTLSTAALIGHVCYAHRLGTSVVSRRHTMACRLLHLEWRKCLSSFRQLQQNPLVWKLIGGSNVLLTALEVQCLLRLIVCTYTFIQTWAPMWAHTCTYIHTLFFFF